MFRVKDSDERPVGQAAASGVLAVVILALLVNLGATFLVIHEYRLLGAWDEDAYHTPVSGIQALRHEVLLQIAFAAALPDTLIESELFGYEKGAFSGAIRQKPGWFEMANGGTLFLDEIGEIPQKTQVDLLRVFEQREIRRLGGEASIRVDVRFLAATQRELDELVADGTFRQDLYYRINVVPLRVPPLRERRDDIAVLTQFFLKQAQQRHNREAKQIAGAAMRMLCDYAWPGNVRQLRNLMERLVVTVEGPTIHVEDLPVELRTTPRQGVTTLEQAVEQAERQAILAALLHCNQHRERTAHLLGVSVRTLHYKMNRYGLQ